MKISNFHFTPYLDSAERGLLDSLKPWHKDFWDESVMHNGVDVKDQIKSIKTKISKALNEHSKDHCTYCGSNLGVTSDSHLDHFAPKYKNPEFTFTLNNLFIACTKCNLSTRKGKKITIRKYHTKYSKCKFKIVHPHFDNLSKHFDYVINGDRKILIKWSTRKGRKTISFFKLNESALTEDRAKTYIYEITKLPGKYEQLMEDLKSHTYISV